MKAKFIDTKKINCHVIPPVGNYALEVNSPKDVHWDHCREQFAAKFNELTSGFYFSHLKKAESIGEFVSKFELIVGVCEPSVFANTEKENVMWIQPSGFWKDCQMKRSLLTILIRCGLNYDIETDNFDDALFGEYKESLYIRETRSAMLRFMFGFTQFTGIVNPISPSTSLVKHGWREEFMKLDDSTIRRKLILPEGKAKEISIIGVEALWT